MGEPTGLAPEQLLLLDRLKTVPGIDAFYLAGGSAIAIHLHHRRSLDLDLFSFTRDVDLQEFIGAVESVVPNVRLLAKSETAVRAVVERVVLDVVRYRYPPLSAPLVGPAGIAIAGLQDLAAMKVAAISQRGLRRDFWDLYAICQHTLSLQEVTELYLRRFGKAQADLYHVLRAMTYFDDAEKEPALPGGLSDERWSQIKRFFCEEAPKLLMP